MEGVCANIKFNFVYFLTQQKSKCFFFFNFGFFLSCVQELENENFFVIVMGGCRSETVTPETEWDERIFYAYSDKLEWQESQVEIPADISKILHSNTKSIIQIENPMTENFTDDDIFENTKIVISAISNDMIPVTFLLKDIIKKRTLIKKPLVLAIHADKKNSKKNTNAANDVCATFETIYQENTACQTVNGNEKNWIFEIEKPEFKFRFMELLEPGMQKLNNFDALFIYEGLHGQGNF